VELVFIREAVTGPKHSISSENDALVLRDTWRPDLILPTLETSTDHDGVVHLPLEVSARILGFDAVVLHLYIANLGRVGTRKAECRTGHRCNSRNNAADRGEALQHVCGQTTPRGCLSRLDLTCSR
jgi:hypothetical protein